MAVIKVQRKVMGIQFLCNHILIDTAQIDMLIIGQDFYPDGVPILTGQKPDIGGIELEKTAFRILIQRDSRFGRIVCRYNDARRSQPEETVFQALKTQTLSDVAEIETSVLLQLL